MFSQRVTALFLAAGLAVLLFGAGGCSTSRHTSGTPITDESVHKIVKGTTTVGEVISVFGAPSSNTPMVNQTIYMYEYKVTKSKIAFMPYFTKGDSIEQSDKLSITFDKSDVVSNFNLTRGIDK